MNLNNFLQNIKAQKRNRCYFSHEYMYCLRIRVWDLNIDTYENQPKEIQLEIDKLINKGSC